MMNLGPKNWPRRALMAKGLQLAAGQPARRGGGRARGKIHGWLEQAMSPTPAILARRFGPRWISGKK